MENLEKDIKGLRKKQNLIKHYHHKIIELQGERKVINKKLKLAEEKFTELIDLTADIDQLELFDNLDQFLIDIEKTKSLTED